MSSQHSEHSGHGEHEHSEHEHGGHGGHSGPGPASHGFWWLDGPTLYFSHLPGFAVPHDLQAICSARLYADEDPRKVYQRDRAKTGADVYTLKSENMVITELAEGRRSFLGSLFRGNFLKDGVEILTGIKVEVDDVLWLKTFPFNAKPLAQLEYFLVGSDRERYLIHVINKAPDFEQVMRVRADAAPPGPLVRVQVEGRANSLDSALAVGQSVYVADQTAGDKFQVEALAEIARTTDFLLTDSRTETEPAPEKKGPITTGGGKRMQRNQRLLISVFDPQEAREAILGGARVIDCEDPAGALGDISPRRVMLIADACLGYKRSLEVQISTNIGENQMLFKRDDAGRAVQRFPSEIAGKAAQASLGVAAAMGVDLHPVNLVKVGLDGMPRAIALEVLKEVVQTLDRSSYFSRSQVVSVFFAQNLSAWRDRRSNPFVVRDLLLLREYIVSDDGTGVDPAQVFPPDMPDAANLNSAFMSEFAKPERAGLDERVFLQTGGLRPGVRLKITELNERKPLDFPDDPNEYIKQIADLTAEAGADGVMLDTRIHTKVARMCCLDFQNEQAPAVQSGLSLLGIHKMSDFADAARYCHLKGIEFWASGSIQPWQAQAVWQLGQDKPEETVDAMAVRSGATGPVRGGQVVIDNRASRRVYRDLVEKYAAP